MCEACDTAQERERGLVKESGLIHELLKTMVNAIVDHGGSQEDLKKILMSEGYAQSIGALFTGNGKVFRVGKQYFEYYIPPNQEPKGSNPSDKRREWYDEQIVAELKQLGREPVTAEELLLFRDEHPWEADVHRYIIALGTLDSERKREDPPTFTAMRDFAAIGRGSHPNEQGGSAKARERGTFTVFRNCHHRMYHKEHRFLVKLAAH